MTAASLRTLGNGVTGLSRRALERPSPEAARWLLGKLIVRRLGGARVVARIVETEAYRQDDPASHTYGRRTPRVEPMFASAGTAYVYRSYGVHWCLNVSVEAEGTGAAVLLRAALVLAGGDPVRERRPTARTDRDLLRGPGNLCRGLGIDAPRHDGVDLLARRPRPDAEPGSRLAGDPGSRLADDPGLRLADDPGLRLADDPGLRLADDGWVPGPDEVVAGPRVGVSQAPDVPWRFHLAGVPEVSRYSRSPRAPAG